MRSRRSLVYSALILLMIVTGGCSPSTSRNTQARNSIVYGLTLIPSGFDPHIHRSTELGIVLRQVYDTLVYRDPVTREFVPGLATEWNITPDGLVYTFTLRQDVTFHDGTPFNAQAVAANLDRIVDPETASQRARFMLGSYTGHQIVDDYTIRLILNSPYTPLLDSLSQVYLGIASPAALAEYSNNRYQFHQVGTGPFQFVEFVPNDRLVIRRNPDYAWGPSFYQPPASPAAVDEIVFRFFVDEATRSLALESGDAQIMGELLPTSARLLTGNSQIQLLPTPIPGQPLQFLMNTRRFPTDNIAVRQALIQATNRGAIVDTVFQGFSPIAWGPLSAQTLFYNREVVGTYPYNPVQARALLESIGFADSDNNGFLNAGDGDLEIIILVPPWGRVPETAQLIQTQWQDIGVRAILQPVPGFTALNEAVSTGEYNLVAFDTPGMDPAFLNDYFATGGPLNWSGFSTPEMDTLLASGVAEADPALRRSIYGQIQRIIMNQALILPIRDYVNLNAASSSINGLRFDSYGWFPILTEISRGQN